MINDSYAVCVNSAILDKHLNEQDRKDQCFDYVYDKAVYLFSDQLKTAECQEDIHDDLIFEIGFIIDRDSWDVDTDDVVKAIYKDYDLKEAK